MSSKRLLKKAIRLFSDILSNYLASSFGNTLTYLVETDAWSIKEDGRTITKYLNKQQNLRAQISSTTIGLRHQIIHFGSVNTFFKKGSWPKPRHENVHILTWFHVVPNDPRLKLIKQAQNDLVKIHTSCTLTKEILVHEGVDPQKIVVIPLGVDLQLFTPVDDEKRRSIRDELQIPKDVFVIGSFQKDGIGWGDGNEPKLIKGPDVFVETVSRLKHLNPFVLLTGPARGYVKQELEKYGIQFKHVYLKHPHDLPMMYHALDLYLITSRIEGGPKALLESWASGIPVVSTKVGMVPDIAVHNQTILMAKSEQIENLVTLSEQLLINRSLCQTISKNARKKVQQYDWNLIAQEYFEKIYLSLL